MVVTNNHKGALKTAKVAGQISLLQRQPSWNRNTGAQCTRESGQSWKLWTAGKLTGAQEVKVAIPFPMTLLWPWAASGKEGVFHRPALLSFWGPKSARKSEEVRWPHRLCETSWLLLCLSIPILLNMASNSCPKFVFLSPHHLMSHSICYTLLARTLWEHDRINAVNRLFFQLHTCKLWQKLCTFTLTGYKRASH